MYPVLLFKWGTMELYTKELCNMQKVGEGNRRQGEVHGVA